MNWFDITLEQSIAIKDLIDSNLSDLQKIEGLLMVIYDVDLNTVPITELKKWTDKLTFLNEEAPTAELKEQYEVDGWKLNMTSIESLKAAQYYDFTEFTRRDNETVDLLSCFLVPDGFKYNDQYNISKLKESLLKLKFVDVKAIMEYISNGISELHSSFSRLFSTSEDNDGEEPSLPSSGYESYGVFNYLMVAKEVSGKTLDAIYETPITEVLFLVCWKIDKAAFDEKQIKEWKRKH